MAAFFEELWSALLAGLAALGLLAPAPAPYFQGYVEGEFVLVAPTQGGRLVSLEVARGARVEEGQALFALEAAEQAAERDRAAAALRQARDRLANLSKGLRPPQLATIEARKAQAEAQMRLARSQLERQRRLEGSPAFSAEQLDQARANYELQRARVAELAAELANAELGLGREDELAAAEAEVAEREAALAAAAWRLDRRGVEAPAAGLVVDTFFEPGETLAAGQPAVSILPPQGRKVRFFVPEAALGGIAVGQRVEIRCDGCDGPVAATVSFVAAEAEFTPPVLYNRDNRNRLVFMVEARPTGRPEALKPGQPVEVRPEAR